VLHSPALDVCPTPDLAALKFRQGLREVVAPRESVHLLAAHAQDLSGFGDPHKILWHNYSVWLEVIPLDF
jgi:hypothetical protein